MWGAGAHRSSSRPFAVTAAAAAAIFFGLVLAPSSWRKVLRTAGWHGLDDDSSLIQTVATKEEVEAVRIEPQCFDQSPALM